MDISNTDRKIGIASFGTMLNGQGFKIFHLTGIFNLLNAQENVHILQLPQGVEIYKDSEIISVMRFIRQNEHYFIFLQYKYAGREKTASNRICYYGSALAYQYNRFNPYPKDIIDFLEHINNKSKLSVSGEREISYLQILQQQLVFDLEGPNYEKPLNDKYGSIKLPDNTIVYKSSFINLIYSNKFQTYMKFFATSSEEVIKNIDRKITNITDECDLEQYKDYNYVYKEEQNEDICDKYLEENYKNINKMTDWQVEREQRHNNLLRDRIVDRYNEDEKIKRQPTQKNERQHLEILKELKKIQIQLRFFFFLLLIGLIIILNINSKLNIIKEQESNRSDHFTSSTVLSISPDTKFEQILTEYFKIPKDEIIELKWNINDPKNIRSQRIKIREER